MGKVIRFILLEVCGAFIAGVAQAQTWPINTPDHMSSPFGPRNLGSQEYPNPGYNYDFHRGIDILGTGNVKAILSGTVIEIYGSGEEQGMGVQIDDNDDPWWNGGYFKYHHFAPKQGLEVGSIITQGEIIGTVASGEDHLDIKYYPYVYRDPVDVWHPLWVLDYPNNDTNFEVRVP